MQQQTQHKPSTDPSKRRAACESCRTQKLKCTGSRPQCLRCVRSGQACIYSVQKTMGRPRKRVTRECEAAVELERGGGREGADVTRTLLTGKAGEVLREGRGDYDEVPSGRRQARSEEAGYTIDGLGRMTGIDARLGNAEQDLIAFSDLPSQRLSNNPSTLPGETPGIPNATSLLPPKPGNLKPPSPPPAPPLFPSCACLSTIYLTLTALITMPTPEPLSPATHPASLERTLDSLRAAQDTASNVLHCVECPKTFLAGMQNTHQLGVLLVCIAERYSKVLLAVSSVEVGENAALGLRGFGADDKVGEISAPDRGYPGAAAGPRDSQPSISAASSWQLRAKQLVHTEIYGLHSSISDLSDSSDAPGAHTHFTALLDQMERRQNFYHQNPQALPADFPRGAVKGGCGEKAISDEKICLKLVSYARRVVEGLDWGS